jgi:hypothetical protein
MYQACNSEASKLAWTKKPKKLLVRNESNPASQQDEIKFAEKVRKAADADADKKEQDKAQKITEQIISSFQLSSAIKTEDFQKKLRARADRAAKRGVKWQAIEADISRKVSELYQADEKSQERVGLYQDKLSEVEL